MIDCIAGYHLNPWTCGIAKFNAILAKHLDVEVVGIRAVELGSFERPLLSVKLSEFSEDDTADLDLWASAHKGGFELFRGLRGLRPDVQELFCPGTILNPQRFMPVDLGPSGLSLEP